MSNLDIVLLPTLIPVAIGAFVLAAFNIDRLVVCLMRILHIHAFPEAIGIAVLIMDQPEQWSADDFRLRHPAFGAIWIANEAYGLHVETNAGKWKPNAIERRIIWNAVDWRRRNYMRAHTARAALYRARAGQ